jgi:uncharacterized membrane protein HdeD (DUF308 family)
LGVVAIIFSIFVFARPLIAAVVMMWIISAFALVFGGLLIVQASRFKRAAA